MDGWGCAHDTPARAHSSMNTSRRFFGFYSRYDRGRNYSGNFQVINFTAEAGIMLEILMSLILRNTVGDW